MGVVFDTNKINIPGDHYIDTIKESSRVRYKYYGVETYFTGTIFTELRGGTISDDTPFYENQTIDTVVKHLESGALLVVFWVFWFFLIAVCLCGFFYMDNRWLE